MALILTLCSGLFFLVGILIYDFINDKNKFSNFSIACALVVIIGLIVGDLLPELLELKKWWFLIFVLIGMFLFLIIDKIVPHHHHDHHEINDDEIEHSDHLIHISTITILALLLHNMIEGMALYGVLISDLKNGLLMLLGIGLHNLPFGFGIANNKKDWKSKFLILILILSGGFGGFIYILFGEISPVLEGIIISLTLGMLIHILINELLKEVWENIKKKETIYGIIIGIVLLVLINLI